MTESEGFKLIILDWEGTISNGLGMVIDAFEKAASQLCLSAVEQESLVNHLGLDITRLINRLYPELSLTQQEKFIEHYHRFLYSKNVRAKLFSGMETLLQTLHDKGAFLSILTCKGRYGLDKDLSELGLQSLFFATRTPNECLSKPNPEGILELMALAGVDERETVMIGDSPSDMEAARHAGVSAFGVDFMSSGQSARLLQAGASQVFHSVSELEDYLLK